MHQCTPENLPKNILEQLEQWMVQNSSLLEGECCMGGWGGDGTLEWVWAARGRQLLRGFCAVLGCCSLAAYAGLAHTLLPPCLTLPCRPLLTPPPVAGATRPGCVQISVSALMSGHEAAELSASFAAMVQRLSTCGLGAVQTSVLAQLDGQAALLDGEKRQVAMLDLAASAEVAPAIASVRPLAMTPAYVGPILVTGRNIGGAEDGLFCRNGGGWVVGLFGAVLFGGCCRDSWGC